MIPTSEDFETFFQRLRDLDHELMKLKDSEVRRAETIAKIKSVSKEWLKLSESLRAMDPFPQENLNLIDTQLKDVLESTNTRTRASTYRKKLSAVLSKFTAQIIIPVIRYEGSPSQVLSRQIMDEFVGNVTADEHAYLEEAARCLAHRCNRASIMMLWTASMARLHGAIEKLGYNTYNAALDKLSQKKGYPFNKISKTNITSLPELQNCRDFDLLVVGMELWKYDLQVFEELSRLLGIRNNAAHPGMLKPLAQDVQQYASKIGTHVFKTVSI